MFKKLLDLVPGEMIVYYYRDSYNKGIVDYVEDNCIHLISGIVIELLSEYMEVYVILVQEMNVIGKQLMVGDSILHNGLWITIMSIDRCFEEYGVLCLNCRNGIIKTIYSDHSYICRHE